MVNEDVPEYIVTKSDHPAWTWQIWRCSCRAKRRSGSILRRMKVEMIVIGGKVDFLLVYGRHGGKRGREAQGSYMVVVTEEKIARQL